MNYFLKIKKYPMDLYKFQMPIWAKQTIRFLNYRKLFDCKITVVFCDMGLQINLREETLEKKDLYGLE